MRSTLKLLVLVFGFCLLSGNVSLAQSVIIGTFEFGDNNSVESYYIKSNVLGKYRFGKNTAEAGFLMNFKNTGQNFFSGYRLTVSRELAIREFTFGVQAFLVQTIDADVLRETNWGIGVPKEWKHFQILMGTYFKIYAFRKETIKTFKIDQDADKIKEPFNLLYSFTYCLKQKGNKWNMGLTITNFDNFLYNQETNPLFNLNSCYVLNDNLSLFAQAWFETSGVFNISASYFGYYLTTGIKFKIKGKKICG